MICMWKDAFELYVGGKKGTHMYPIVFHSYCMQSMILWISAVLYI